eukprot:231240-Pyramimonas_sp.AAC.1
MRVVQSQVLAFTAWLSSRWIKSTVQADKVHFSTRYAPAGTATPPRTPRRHRRDRCAQFRWSSRRMPHWRPPVALRSRQGLCPSPVGMPGGKPALGKRSPV